MENDKQIWLVIKRVTSNLMAYDKLFSHNTLTKKMKLIARYGVSFSVMCIFLMNLGG